MKEEIYNKIVEKLGEDKAKEVRNVIEEANRQKKQIEKWNRERDKKLLEVGIKKEDLEDCGYYNGLRFRGHGIAQWDKKLDRFIIIAYEFGVPVIEKLEHFADVIEIRYDGFVPIEKLDKNKYYDIRRMDPKKIEEEIKNRKLE
jgi:hypothetical protein